MPAQVRAQNNYPSLRSAAIGAVAVLAFVLPTLAIDAAAAAAPTASVLLSPKDGATTASTDVELSVRAEDADGGPLNVSFLGRKPGTAAPATNNADPFSFVVLPDTQNYTYSGRQGTIAQQAQWIVNQRDNLDIAFVSQLGDLVSNFDNATQWGYTSSGLKILDDAGIPNSVVPGNHDFDNATKAVGLYDGYFAPSRYSSAAWSPSTAKYGGYLGQNLFGPDPVDRRNMDNFSLFSAGGNDFLVLNLEWEAPAYALDWGRKVLSAYPNRTAIFITHSFVTGQGGRRTGLERQPDGTSPQQIWSDFVSQQCSIKLVLSGHEHNGDLGEASRVDENRCGDRVPQILTDYQDRANGGDGWLRYYTFTPATNSMTATTYSPKLGRYETDSDSQFTVPFPLSKGAENPFSPIGSVDVDAGQIATVPWIGRENERTYEWKAVISDGVTSVETPTWTFTTPKRSSVSDAFSRVVAAGWGSAETGEPWSLSGSTSNYSVSSGTGRISVPPGSTRTAIIGTVPVSDTSVVASFATTEAATGGGTYATVLGRIVGNDSYRAKLRVAAGGGLTLSLVRFSNNAESTLASTPLANTTLTAGRFVKVRLQATGVSPTTLRATAWLVGSAEPAAAQVTAMDSTAALQKAGAEGVSIYQSSSSAASAVVQIDDFIVKNLAATPTPVPNAPPTASFPAPTPQGRTIRVDGTASSDPNGRIDSWSWSFGDGGSARSAIADHEYATDGTYTVSLTVTDDAGASSTTTRSVSIVSPPPNVAPTAVIADPVINGRTVTFSGAGSTDQDGTVESWGWTFGDGTTGTGRATSRQYSADGTYTVTLTVTDNSGATAIASRTLTIATPPPTPTLVSDGFTRSVNAGWGAADVGGSWTVSGTANRYSTNGSVGELSLSAPGTTAEAVIAQGASATTNLRADVAWNRTASSGTIYGSLIVRRINATNDYRVKVTVTSTNKPQLSIVRRVDGAETTVATATLANALLTPGVPFTVVAQAAPAPGGGTNIQAKMFATGSAEPGWLMSAKDVAAGLQGTGTIGVNSYMSSSATAPVKMTVDNLISTTSLQ